MTQKKKKKKKDVGESLFLAQVLRARAIMLSFPAVGFLPNECDGGLALLGLNAQNTQGISADRSAGSDINLQPQNVLYRGETTAIVRTLFALCCLYAVQHSITNSFIMQN